MKPKMAIVLQELTDGQRERIRAAAERNGFDIRFFKTPEEDPAFVEEAEVIFGQDAELSLLQILR